MSFRFNLILGMWSLICSVLLGIRPCRVLLGTHLPLNRTQVWLRAVLSNGCSMLRKHLIATSLLSMDLLILVVKFCKAVFIDARLLLKFAKWVTLHSAHPLFVKFLLPGYIWGSSVRF